MRLLGCCPLLLDIGVTESFEFGLNLLGANVLMELGAFIIDLRVHSDNVYYFLVQLYLCI